MRRCPKLLITQSLLGAWLYQYQAFDQESAHKDFLRVLRREKSKPTQAILDGIQFENMVTACCEGSPPPEDHKWGQAVRAIADRVQGAQFQVVAQRTAVVEDIPFLLYGRLDALKAGVIYDIKFSRSYQVGKYLDSPQHPMYFALVPEAQRFEYLVFTGSDVCVEKYDREDTPDIRSTIRDFMKYLEASKLDKLYCQKWEARQ